jgi:hypothetical protein
MRRRAKRLEKDLLSPPALTVVVESQTMRMSTGRLT